LIPFSCHPHRKFKEKFTWYQYEMEATSSVNLYPTKSENDQIMDSLTGGPPYHTVGLAQSQVYADWNPQPQRQTAVSEYPYAYDQSSNYASSTQYADTTMYHQPQPSPTTE
jgi:hypothetical protein